MNSLVRALFIAVLTFHMTTAAGAKSSLPKPVWVVVTHAALYCGSSGDETGLRDQLLQIFANPPKDGKLPEGCGMLKLGEKYLLDDEQSEADTKIAVKMWAPVCLRGCTPTMTPLYAPPRQLVGPYLKPTKPPKGW